MPITVYQYPKCGTCRKALAWLDARGIDYDRVDIVAAPPSRAVLARALALSGVPVRKLFNTSGQSYRQGGFKERVATMSEAEALTALAGDGKLIKRPLVIGEELALVGFREPEWAQALAS
ncbi:arsenate reductase family protein [Haliangium sp.]|uniref:arsenate reductase family protein n=1 Tax=Haliangium sp. TaxID=2663208 RepID=UPI003D13B1B4